MKIKSAARALSAIAAIAIVQNLQVSGVSAALCTAAATVNEYNAIETQISACEAKTSVTMELPLAARKKQTICASCPELAAQANAETLPDCKIVQTSDGRSFKLQKQFERLFKPCITLATSDSGSSGDAAATTTAAPATTTTITPTVTPATVKPQTTTAAPSESTAVEDDSSNESGGSALEEGGTVKPSTGTSASKSATKSSDNADWDASSSSNDTTNNESTKQSASSGSGSFVTVELAAGIAGGVLAVVLLSAIFVVAWRRYHHRDFEPDNSLSLNSSTSGSQQMPFQFSMSTASTGRAQKWTDSYNSMGNTAPSAAASSTMRDAGNLWEDEVIVAARIPKDKVMAATLVSRGGFGEVYRGMYNHQQVAIKMLLPETRKDLKEINAFLAEVKLMATLEHERIVQFIGVAWDSLNDICVVSEFMEGGDLKGVLTVFEEQQRPHGFDHTKVKIALHIAHALTYMHSLQPIVLHRDLKSKNILLDTELRAKLTDFGVSRERSDTTMTAAVGTSLWMAPEVMLGGRYDGKADVFSFGIVLSELDTHAIPYGTVKESGSGRRIPDSAVLQMIALGRLKVKFSPNAHPEMVKLGNTCVSLDPRERPSASEVLYQLHTALESMYVVM